MTFGRIVHGTMAAVAAVLVVAEVAALGVAAWWALAVFG